MDIKLLKKQVIIRLSICSIVLLVSSIGLFYSYYYNKKLSRHNIYLANKIELMNQKMGKIHKREIILHNNFVLWKELSLTNLYTNDSYIRNLDLLINDLCKKYKVFVSKVQISESTIVDNNYRKKHIKVMKNQIKIEFSSISDEHVFLLLHAMKHEIPGYIVIKSFNIEKNMEITNSVIQKTENGSLVKVVSGSIIFDLYSVLNKLKDKVGQNAK